MIISFHSYVRAGGGDSLVGPLWDMEGEATSAFRPHQVAGATPQLEEASTKSSSPHKESSHFIRTREEEGFAVGSSHQSRSAGKMAWPGMDT